MAKLDNDRHERFCQEYVVDLNGTQAYIRAGYSERGAEASASKLLANPKVKARIAELQAKVASKLEITAERVLMETARIAYSDPRKLFNEDGSLKHIKDLDDDTAAAISGIEYDGTVRKIRRYDKNAALANLGKHLKLFRDQVELNIGEGLAEAIASARKRAP